MVDGLDRSKPYIYLCLNPHIKYYAHFYSKIFVANINVTYRL